MADGSIVFNTKLDNAELEKQLSGLTKKIGSAEEKLSQKRAARAPLAEQSATLAAQLDAAKARLEYMNSVQTGFSGDVLTRQKETVASLQARWNATQAQVERYDVSISKGTAELERNRTKAGALAQELGRASGASDMMGVAVVRAQKNMNVLAARIKAVVRSALVFVVITQALANLRGWIGNVVKASPEATEAISRLKGALLTMAQPLVNVVIPAFTAFVNVLTRVIYVIAQLFSMLSGATIDSTKEAAAALNDETTALEETGAAAKDAQKQMSGFDEINKLSNNSASGGAQKAETTPSFDLGSDTEEGQLQKILDLVKLIGAGFLGWKIGAALGLSLGKIAWLALTIYSTIKFVEDALDAIKNGVNLDNLTGMLISAAGAALGLYIALGPIAAGIALIVAGIAMLVIGFMDADKNGMNMHNTFLMIGGILAAGIGIAILAGSWIPLLIAGIAAIVLAIVSFAGEGDRLIQGIKDIFGGLIDFITGVFTGDWDKAWEGVKRIFKGVWNTILSIFGSVVNLIIRGINWLIAKLNTIHFEIPDWVPLIGGKSFGISIPSVKEWEIPYLATGAVIPPNREFMAILGDQKSGTNIEAPLDTIVQAVLLAMQKGGIGGGGQTIENVINLDGEVIYRNQKKVAKRHGVSLAGV